MKTLGDVHIAGSLNTVVILDCAAEWGADLIIVGSHGRKGIARFVLGSVSEAVARSLCPLSVVIARCGPRGQARRDIRRRFQGAHL